MAIQPIENGESGLSVRNKINSSFAELEQKEKRSNKSQDVEADSTSTVKYPSVKAIVDYFWGKLTNYVSYNTYVPDVLEIVNIENFGILNFYYKRVKSFYELFGKISVITNLGGYIILSLPENLRGYINGYAISDKKSITIDTYDGMKIIFPPIPNEEIFYIHCWGELIVG